MSTSFEISLDQIEPDVLAELNSSQFNAERFDLLLSRLENVFAKTVFETTQLNAEATENIEVSLQIVNREVIRQVNNEFREKDKETDVISLSMYEDLRHSAEEAIGPMVSLGDLIVCGPVACDQAKESGLDIETELIELIIHGILHLCGFDHEISESEKEEMYRWERKIFELIEGDRHE